MGNTHYLMERAVMDNVSRLTTKYQATIPASVRRALGLKAGDRVSFAIKGRTVTIAKAKPGMDENLAWRLTQAHAMRDWDTPEDDEAFRDL
jgi:AbrB family looped-hinge helix DNA binding protein